VSVEENMALVRRFFEARGKADLDAASLLLERGWDIRDHTGPESGGPGTS
jgi:hypothetical protein